MFGRVMVSQTAASNRQQGSPDRTDSRAHPDKLLDTLEQGGGFYSSDGEGHMMTNRAGTSMNFWKSRNFPHLLNGVAIGDVDGDGKIETILATPHKVLIYKNEHNRFYEAAKYEGPSNNNIIGVDVGDINGNGIAEIFVTSLNANRNRVNSMVIEFRGDNYKAIVGNSSWYYRVVPQPADGRKVLLGQRHRSGEPFSGRIYEMAWEQAEYVPGRQIKTPKEVNLMGLTIGDVVNNKQESTVAFGKGDMLRIFDASGREIWTGSEPYGGSTLYYLMPLTDTGQVQNRGYLPMRLLVKAPKNGEKSQIIVAGNQEKAGRKLDQFRWFSHSRIVSFTWDGLGLSTNWVTRKVSGHIRDFTIGDFNNDGRDELIAAVIIKEGSVAFTKSKSALIAWEMLE